MDENGYEVRVKVRDLAGATKIIQMLSDAGYTDVEMGSSRTFWPRDHMNRMEAYRGYFKRMILKAMLDLNALDRKRAVSVDDIVGKIRSGTELHLHRCSREGVLTRTVSMITSAVLAGRYGWVEVDGSKTPRRFWLTEAGVKAAKEI
ncbi:MAG: hypothetical protein ACE5KU_02765 [Nitrososphaerales archaeon]